MKTATSCLIFLGAAVEHLIYNSKVGGSNLAALAICLLREEVKNPLRINPIGVGTIKLFTVIINHVPVTKSDIHISLKQYEINYR
jgi:hypothetical protein